MRWVAIALAAVLVMAAGMGSAQTPPSTPPVKLALVIGNADYDGDGRIDVSAAGVASSESRGFVPDLRNPLNDAGDIRDALQRIGFRVDYVVNADGARMGAALAEFGTKVAVAPDTAQIVVYYAGHAIQVDGANFLIPVKAQLPATDFSTMPTSQVQTVLRRVAVSTTEITEQLKQLRAPGVNLLMFDACRNNPWETRVRGLGRSVSATRGLAEIAAPPRTVIAFSTAPGRTADDGAGRNSPFAAALKNRIGLPGNVRDILDSVGDEVQTATDGRQTPWFHSASVGQVCLATCRSSPNEAAGAAVSAPSDPMERTLWVLNSIENGAWSAEDPFSLAARVLPKVDRRALEALTSQNDARAMFFLACGYAIGIADFSADDAKARSFFRRAANLGHAPSQANLGGMLINGAGGTPLDIREGVRLLQLSASQGNAIAQANLGHLYFVGDGVPKDEREAARLFRNSADQGSSMGRTNLGWFYQQGLGGLRKNEVEAQRLFTLAAAQGNALAQLNLGLMYLEGRGRIVPNRSEAIRYLRLAAQQGTREAQIALSQLGVGWTN